MDDATEYCILQLVEIIEKADVDPESIDQNSQHLTRLLPIIIENTHLDCDSLRLSFDRVEEELVELIAEACDAETPVEYIENNLSDFKTDLYDLDLETYQIAFPLNIPPEPDDLLPDEIQICDVCFTRLSATEWKSRFLPGTGKEHPTHGGNEGKFVRFIDDCPNSIQQPGFSYWYASFRARNQTYALDRVRDRLEILLSMMNYAIWYRRTGQKSGNEDPWPTRWARLREPFVYLVHDDEDFSEHVCSDDPSPRNPARVSQTDVERFRTILDRFPDFQNRASLDGYLLNSLRTYQSAMTEPDTKTSFFDFWRGVEILALAGQNEQLTEVVDRTTALIDWNDGKLGEIRANRTRTKRNTYVHEGEGVRLTEGDRQLAKILHECLLDLYLNKRDVWSKREMQFALTNFTIDIDRIQQLRTVREEELELINWFEQIAPQS